MKGFIKLSNASKRSSLILKRFLKSPLLDMQICLSNYKGCRATDDDVHELHMGQTVPFCAASP
jgi:hypothetical protein